MFLLSIQKDIVYYEEKLFAIFKYLYEVKDMNNEIKRI